MGANGMREVKFDYGETHKLAASWIELKLWSKSSPIEDEENDDDGDEDEDPSDSEQASSKDDNEDQENGE